MISYSGATVHPHISSDAFVRSKAKETIQRLAVATSFTPFTYFYKLIYALAILVTTLVLRRVEGVVSIYLRRGLAKGEVVYGLSDIDLAVIVEDRDGEWQPLKDGVRKVHRKLTRFIPLFGESDRELEVYSKSELLSMYADLDFYRYRFNEGKYTWKLLYGEEIVRALPELRESELYLPATAELKTWWALLNDELAPRPDYPLFKRKYLWYKAISEALKIYLFVRHGQHIQSREEALTRAKGYLSDEQNRFIDRVQRFRVNLTLKNDLAPDELMRLFIKLTGEIFTEAARKIYTESNGRVAVLNLPGSTDLLASDNNLSETLACLKATMQKELEAYIDYVALMPQIEFPLDVLDNSDIDSYYFVLVQKLQMPLEKLGQFRSLFSDTTGPRNVEPFIVTEDNVAFSLQVDRIHNSIKIVSPRTCPLFFAMLPEGVLRPYAPASESNESIIHCHLPPNALEETLNKRIAKINTIFASKDIYKMKIPDFLMFFWAAARTKLLARSSESETISIPLTSGQILDALLQVFPGESDWLQGLHREYIKDSAGEENESYRYFTKSIDFLKQI